MPSGPLRREIERQDSVTDHIWNWTWCPRRLDHRSGHAESVNFPGDASVLDPKLVRGLDGKEGLDLGNGTMKMPDGSIRSITKSGLEIPEAPAGGFGGGRGSRHDAAADKIVMAAEMIQNAGFHHQLDVKLSGGGARVVGMRARGRGMTADMGESMPDLHDLDKGDWL